MNTNDSLISSVIDTFSETDKIRTSIYKKQNSIYLRKSKNEIEKQQTELAVLLGVDEKISVQADDNFLFEKPINIGQILETSLESRPDYMKMKNIEQWSINNYKYQKSLAYPSPEIGLIYNNQATIPYIGVFAAFDLPFFDRNQGEIKKSAAMQEQIKHKIYYAEKNIKTEIEIFYSDYKLKKEIFDEYKEIVEHFQNVLNESKISFNNDEISVVDYIDVNSQLFDLQEEFFESMEEYLHSYLKLLYVTGHINMLLQ